MDDNDFFASVAKEGSDPFSQLDTQEETPADSQPENVDVDKPTEPVTESVPEEEKPIPYHKDPRWKKQREDLQAEKEAREQAEERARLFEEEVKNLRSGNRANQPEFLTDLIGENEVVAQNFQKYEQNLRQSILEDLRKQQDVERQQAKAIEEKSMNWVNQNLDELSEETGITMRTSTGELTPTAKGLLELINEFPIDDGRGNLDIKKGYEMYQKLREQEQFLQSQKAQARKDIADSTISKDNSGKSQRDYVTQNDLRGKGWNSL